MAFLPDSTEHFLNTYKRKADGDLVYVRPSSLPYAIERRCLFTFVTLFFN